MIVQSLIGPTLKDIVEQLEKVHPKCALVEWRFDLFDSFEFGKIERLYYLLDKSSIFTYRDSRNFAFYKKLLKLKPAFLDIGFKHADELRKLTKLLSEKTKLILSDHAYDLFPKDLNRNLKNLNVQESEVTKLAYSSKSSIDALKMLLFVKEQRDPSFTGIVMGEGCAFSRILHSIFSRGFNFTRIDGNTSSAKGQLLVDELLDFYPF